MKAKPIDTEEEAVEALMRAAYQSSKAKRAHDDVEPSADLMAADAEQESGAKSPNGKRPKIEL